ncbi:MAG TPA: hypothetical protein VG407_02580 [Caulobacteraceae bacterium]|nr:hypothetical protein [Caulobacteraceae bacterium]
MSLVVITGASRSGSTFLGDLMRRAENVCAFHEHIGGRDFFCVSAYAPDHPIIRHEIRTGVADMRRQAGARPIVADVNSNVGFATAALRAEEPGVKLFHLARDGRDVIASNWLRKMYSDWAKGVDIRPDTDAELDAWAGFDRFEKLCWQWNRIASELIDKSVPVVRLEQAVEDFDYLTERLLVPSGIALSKAVWEERRSRRVNRSRFKLRDLLRGRPTDFEWTPEREARFQALCGKSMRKLGYS